MHAYEIFKFMTKGLNNLYLGYEMLCFIFETADCYSLPYILMYTLQLDMTFYSSLYIWTAPIWLSAHSDCIELTNYQIAAYPGTLQKTNI